MCLIGKGHATTLEDDFLCMSKLANLLVHACEECGNALRIRMVFFNTIIPEADEMDDSLHAEGGGKRASQGMCEETSKITEDTASHAAVGLLGEAGIVDEDCTVGGDGEDIILDGWIEAVPARIGEWMGWCVDAKTASGFLKVANDACEDAREDGCEGAWLADEKVDVLPAGEATDLVFCEGDFWSNVECKGMLGVEVNERVEGLSEMPASEVCDENGIMCAANSFFEKGGNCKGVQL